jgi:hypothetical protein
LKRKNCKIKTSSNASVVSVDFIYFWEKNNTGLVKANIQQGSTGGGPFLYTCLYRCAARMGRLFQIKKYRTVNFPLQYIDGLCICFFNVDRVMVFNAIFKNISVISRRSVSLVRVTGVPGKKHQTAVSHPGWEGGT